MPEPVRQGLWRRMVPARLRRHADAAGIRMAAAAAEASQMKSMVEAASSAARRLMAAHAAPRADDYRLRMMQPSESISSAHARSRADAWSAQGLTHPPPAFQVAALINAFTAVKITGKLIGMIFDYYFLRGQDGSNSARSAEIWRRGTAGESPCRQPRIMRRM